MAKVKIKIYDKNGCTFCKGPSYNREVIAIMRLIEEHISVKPTLDRWEVGQGYYVRFESDKSLRDDTLLKKILLNNLKDKYTFTIHEEIGAHIHTYSNTCPYDATFTYVLLITDALGSKMSTRQRVMVEKALTEIVDEIYITRRGKEYSNWCIRAKMILPNVYTSNKELLMFLRRLDNKGLKVELLELKEI